MQRLGFLPNASLEHKKLSVDLAEVIIKWELQRIKEDETEHKILSGGMEEDIDDKAALKRSCNEDYAENYRKKVAADNARNNIPEASSSVKLDETCRSIGKVHCDTVLNFLIRLACQVNDSQPTILNSGDNLSRRCIILLKTAMRPDVWPQPFELKLNWMDKIFNTIENSSTNLNNTCTALDFLTFLTSIMKPDQLLTIIRPIQKGLSTCVVHQNTKIVRLMHVLITRLMTLYPPDPQHKNDDLDVLYSAISKTFPYLGHSLKRKVAQTHTFIYMHI
uniref:Pre-rRNA-processing protein Ipi1 N-terminal domain-containing protein n=1 Tax=Glossina brevipalpis TaxID=37001 RepID=A0A1A9WAE6_9MUSC